jgi:hypothetical protein
MAEAAIYPWEVLEDILRELSVPKAAVVARQVLDRLEDRGWELKRESLS